MHPATTTQPKISALPATTALRTVPALPATATLPPVSAEPATATLAPVSAEPATATLAPVSAEPATATLAPVSADPATATLAPVIGVPATALRFVSVCTMLDYLRRHHIALIALFIALGGTSYAATQLAPNSVGNAQLRANSVSSSKLRDGSVTAAKLSPSLRASLRGRGSTPTAPPASWRYPNIAGAISAAGQTVSAQRVITVPADAPWVKTGLSIASGQRLWIDTRSDGRWSGNPSLFPYSNADGLPVYQGRYRVYADAPVESLIGFVGSSPPTPPEVSVPIGAPRGGPGGITNPGFLAAGNSLLNFAPRTTGEIWLRNNDNTNYISDVGHQIAKVIVATERTVG